MGKILHLINHDVMYLRSLIASKLDDVEHVVDGVHDIIASVSDLPSLILAKGFIDVQFLFTSEEGIASN